MAVVDTGFDFKSSWILAETKGLAIPKFCVNTKEIPDNKIDDDGNGYIDDVSGWNFVDNSSDLTDNHGHGTHIAGIVAKETGDIDYCILVLKYFDPKVKSQNPLEAGKQAFKYAKDFGVDVINYSGGGEDYNQSEYDILNQALKQGVKVIAAAGNESKNTVEKPYYPASYTPEIESVGNIDLAGVRAPTSNYGPHVSLYREGTDVLSLCPNNRYCYMSGTSQATAVRTAEIVKELYEIKKLDTDVLGNSLSLLAMKLALKLQ